METVDSCWNIDAIFNAKEVLSASMLIERIVLILLSRIFGISTIEKRLPFRKTFLEISLQNRFMPCPTLVTKSPIECHLNIFRLSFTMLLINIWLQNYAKMDFLDEFFINWGLDFYISPSIVWKTN